MKNIIIGIAVLSLSWLSCNKYRNNQYSTWYVNGEEFKTNEVKVTIYSQTFIISSIPKNKINGFEMSFNLSKPVGSFYIGKQFSESDPQIASIGIDYMNKKYLVLDSNAIISSEEINNKLKFTLNNTWFYNYYFDSNNNLIINQNDSILVNGIFNEP